MKKRIKLNALTIGIALIVCAVFHGLLIRWIRGNCLDDFIELMGLALLLLGLSLRTSARGYKAEHSSNGKNLVTGGPYGLVRNPMYLGIVVSGVGAVMVIGTWWALAFFLAGFFFRYLYLFKKEENVLAQTFGQQYERYKQSVSRIVPTLEACVKKDFRAFLPLKTQWFKPEMPGISVVIAGVLAVELWEEAATEGVPAMMSDGVALLLVIAVAAGFKAYLIRANAKTASQGTGSS
jgi:protein-S-isoprenylcysteine O-methyltransferase Ste14